MAGTVAILAAVWRAVVRDLRSLNSLAGNNFFIFCILLLQQSGSFVMIILGLVLLFPLGSDPLSKIPRERLESWPLTPMQRVLLRIGSLAISPAAWLTLALLAATAPPWLSLQFLALIAAMQALGMAFAALRARAPQAGVFRWAPPLPGVIGGMIRKDIRQFLSVLDPYPALVLTLSGAAYQVFAPQPDPEAKFGLTLLVVLAMSTSGQCLFGLDGESGISQYRLWPVRGWRVLAAKGLAHLAVTVALCLLLEPVPALAAGMVALAVGNHVSVRRPLPQARWRFTGGSLGVGLLQLMGMMSAANLVHRTSAWLLAPCALLWAASVWFYGRDLDA